MIFSWFSDNNVITLSHTAMFNRSSNKQSLIGVAQWLWAGRVMIAYVKCICLHPEETFQMCFSVYRVCLSVCIPFSPSTACLSSCLSVHLAAYLPTWLPALSICLSICMYTCLSDLSICQPVCLPLRSSPEVRQGKRAVVRFPTCYSLVFISCALSHICLFIIPPSCCLLFSGTWLSHQHST